ncbi:SEC23-interacting protein [Caerostris extrusa]|uniref:SEC23-interacting protein n=1 Tax=Caerostris extrusa TaxID=172846 RepID=A0AAV4QJI1_CAEEX|nr:SEC23-interacting protein [Caerostris extrusa]
MRIYPSQALETGMSLIEYPSLLFEPAGFFALGSPIAFFLAVRGYDAINENFRLPTCPAFFHIFHPYDPVAFLVEPMIKPNFSEKPVLIPHHKGRKRLHIHIRENFGIAKNQYTPNSDEINKMIEPPVEGTKIGLLNGGRRIDYVLQEKPIEAINEYLFALSSHATYWNSEDTVLMMLREIYATQGIFIYPEQMPSERNTLVDSLMGFSGNDSNMQTNLSSVETSNIPTESMPVIHTGPPPLSGFVKQSPFSK